MLEQLMSNPLFLQILGSMGPEIAKGGSGMDALGGIINQQTSAKSMTGLMGIFQKMLKGELAEGTEMKLSGDKGMTMSIPSFQIKQLSGESGGLFGGGEGLSLGGTPPSVPTPQANPSPFGVQAPTMPNLPAPAPQQAGGGNMGALAKLLNPSSSLPDIPRSALAGLSTQDISAALSGMLGVEGLDQKKLETLLDMPYKDAATKSALAGIPYKQALTIEALARVQKMNMPDDERTAAMKNYQYALGQGSKLTFDEWMQTQTGNWKDYQKAVEGGYSGGFQTWLEHMRSIGGGQEQGVTWTTATKELTKRFGKLDPTGMWAVTPELQYFHREAQRILTELKDQGVEPLKAINESEDRARNKQQQIEQRYQQYMDTTKNIRKSGDRDRKTEEIKSLFYSKYGYLPATRGE